MRIAVIGAGAMGSIFGAHLSTVAEVVLVHTEAEHVRSIRERGLILETPGGEERVYNTLQATTDPGPLGRFADLALIFTKAYDTAAAVQTASALLKPDGMALTLQNGLGNRETIAAALGEERTVAGVTSHGGTVLGPGRVRHAGRGQTHMAGSAHRVAEVEAVAELFGRAGIEAIAGGDADSLIWGKLVVNVGINALAAVCRVPNGVLGTDRTCRALMERAVDEAVAVSRRLGIVLPYDQPLSHVLHVCSITAENRASMLQDILRGKKTEIAHINGAVADRGEAAGIQTPVNRLLADLVTALESTAEHRVGD